MKARGRVNSLMSMGERLARAEEGSGGFSGIFEIVAADKPGVFG
jgi:hypothetical protein